MKTKDSFQSSSVCWKIREISLKILTPKFKFHDLFRRDLKILQVGENYFRSQRKQLIYARHIMLVYVSRRRKENFVVA